MEFARIFAEMYKKVRNFQGARGIIFYTKCRANFILLAGNFRKKRYVVSTNLCTLYMLEHHSPWKLRTFLYIGTVVNDISRRPNPKFSISQYWRLNLILRYINIFIRKYKSILTLLWKWLDLFYSAEKYRLTYLRLNMIRKFFAPKGTELLLCLSRK